MTKRLDGKRALIVGASTKDNMGQCIARRFLEEGAQVLVAGRTQSVLKDFSEEIGCQWAPCDLTDPESIENLCEATVAALGGIDIAINSTGWGLLKPFLETTHDELMALTMLQYVGPFHFYQAVLRRMARSSGGSGGSIIQISSATATIMLNDHAAYMGTKAGADHVIRCIAHEFGIEGVRANSISPGLTDTPMTAEAKQVPGIFEAFLAGYPLGRIGTSEDIAAAAVFLASDECFMTGENLQVNGGLTLRRNPMNSEIEASVVKATQRQD